MDTYEKIRKVVLDQALEEADDPPTAYFVADEGTAVVMIIPPEDRSISPEVALTKCGQFVRQRMADMGALQFIVFVAQVWGVERPIDEMTPDDFTPARSPDRQEMLILSRIHVDGSKHIETLKVLRAGGTVDLIGVHNSDDLPAETEWAVDAPVLDYLLAGWLGDEPCSPS